MTPAPDRPGRGRLWFTALAREPLLMPEYPRSILAADTPLGPERVRYLAVVPDPANRFPRARCGELGLDEAWSFASCYREVIAADCDNEGDRRAIVAIVDVPSQAYGRCEEILGLHLACAAASDAATAARLAGHPDIALIVGQAISGGFLAHGAQANRILALDDPGVVVHAMAPEAAARVTRRTVAEHDRLAREVLPMAYDIRTCARLGIFHRLIEGIDADRRKDEFLATLAHELRNPLAPIRNALYLFRVADEPAAREEVRAMMDRHLTHMVRLIDDLLDVSRITRGKVELRMERVELGSIVRTSLETSRPFIEAGCHELTVTLPDGPTYANVDPTRFSQVLSNLLNNPAKFTPPGGRIELLAEQDSSHIVVRVRDSGIGIPREMLRRIFDMFTQVDRRLERTQGGLGIGLTLVKRLVGLHGGTVEARSEGRDQGSEFIVRMPASERRRGADGQHSGGAARDRECRGGRILIVDDNVDAAVSLGKILQSLGSEICTTHDGIEAVKAAAVFRPEVILLDIGMPR